MQVSWVGGSSEEADEKADADGGEETQHVEVQVGETEQQKGLIRVRQRAGTAMGAQLHSWSLSWSRRFLSFMEP